MQLQALEDLERRLRVTSLRIFKSHANEDLIAWMRLQEEINRETLVYLQTLEHSDDHSTQKVRYCECGHVDGSHEDVDGRSPCGVSSCPCSEFRPTFAPSGSAVEEPKWIGEYRFGSWVIMQWVGKPSEEGTQEIHILCRCNTHADMSMILAALEAQR